MLLPSGRTVGLMVLTTLSTYETNASLADEEVVSELDKLDRT